MEWTVGKIKITSIVEQDLTRINELIKGAKRSAVQDIEWLKPCFADEDGTLTGLIQSFVLETPNKIVVVDTCVGDDKERRFDADWHKLQSGFLDRFKAAGYEPNAVDFVLCTHLHVDHVGWNTRWDGTSWVPTFPNARYLFDETELNFWRSENAREYADPSTAASRGEAGRLAFNHTQKQTHSDSVEPIISAGLADTVGSNHQVCEGVALIPTPGHTPGHVSVKVSSNGAQAVITGDCIHHPCQLARPDWPTFVDHDQEQSTKTRQELFHSVLNNKMLLVGSHFSEPTAGYIEPDGKGYILKST